MEPINCTYCKKPIVSKDDILLGTHFANTMTPYHVKCFDEAKQRKGITGNLMLSILERRLDNVIYRSGFASSRSISRQTVNHGHFLVNNKRVAIPSYRVEIGDIISIKPRSKPKQIFFDLINKLKKYEAPLWLLIDKKNLEIKIKGNPEDNDLPKNFNMNSIVAFYSK